MAEHTTDDREPRRELPFTRFDVILLFIFALTLAIIAANFVLIWTGREQFSQGFWGFATPVCTGEIVMFSLYQIAKRVAGSIPKHLKKKSELVEDIESSEKEETND